MDKNRKEIIVKEIEYWEENRMLPAHYCQYLLTLYTEGKGKENFKKHIKPPGILVLAIVFFVFAFIISLLIHVLNWSVYTKGAVIFGIYTLLMALIVYIRKKTEWYVFYLALYNIGLFFSLLIFLYEMNFHIMVMLGFSAFYIVFLFLQGLLLRLKAIKIASLIGLICVVGTTTAYYFIF